MAEESQSGPRIVVAYQHYEPPFDSEKVVRRMLNSIPTKFLRGLHSVVLTNAQALSRKERDRKTWGRGRITLGETLGYYSKEWHGEPARITLLIDNLEKQWGRRWLWFGLTRNASLAEVLFHEVGHHIHHLHVPEYDDKENVADKWSQKLWRRYFRERYWYVIPIAVPFALLGRLAKAIAKLSRKQR